MEQKQEAPKMLGKDASGGRVSLLNDEQSTPRTLEHPTSRQSAGEQLSRLNIGETMQTALNRHHDHMNFGQRYASAPLSSDASSPILTRQNSWGTINESDSPTTPMSPEEAHQGYYHSQHNSPTLFQNALHTPAAFNKGSSPSGHPHLPPIGLPYGHSSHPSSTNSSPSITQNSYRGSYFPQSVNRPSNALPDGHEEREAVRVEAKRYPCRYATNYNCDKTFTTSGHASRHSKIHTAEKGVHCTFPGCEKKFTRSDNMKQHLETHKREKRRSTEHGVSKHSSQRSARPSSSGSASYNAGAMEVLANAAVSQQSSQVKR